MEDAKLERWVNGHKTWDEIAEELGRTPLACSVRYDKLIRTMQLIDDDDDDDDTDSDIEYIDNDHPNSDTNIVKDNQHNDTQNINNNKQSMSDKDEEDDDIKREEDETENGEYLSKQQVLTLNPGDKVDHKHKNGTWYGAKIKFMNTPNRYITIKYLEGKHKKQEILIEKAIINNLYQRFAVYGSRSVQIQRNNNKEMCDNRPIISPRHRHQPPPIQNPQIIPIQVSSSSSSRISSSQISTMSSIANYSEPLNFDQFMLNIAQIQQLKVGDKLDHKDCQGRFIGAIVVEHHPHCSRIKLHYFGYGKDDDAIIDYSKLHWRHRKFAKYQTISTRICTQFKSLKVGTWLKCLYKIQFTGYVDIRLCLLMI